MKALTERTQHVVHLTHNDLDAVGGDAVHRMKYGDIFTIWCSVGKFPTMLDAVAGAPGKGDLLSISDLGYQDNVVSRLKKARSNGWKIEWRDHHRWHDEEIREVEALVEILNIDTEICATGIVVHDLMPDDPVAREVAEVVCDYDLWKHQDPRSKVLGQVVMRKAVRNHVRDCLLKGLFTDKVIEEEYADIFREMNSDIKRSIRHTKIFGIKYRIAFAPLYGYPSETAHSIRDTFGTDIEVVVSSSGRFSIRSVPDISHIIAREFGGGGHPNAAGGNFAFTLFDKLSFWILRKTGHYRKLANIADALS